MKKYKLIIIAINLVIVLVVLNYAVFKKEHTLAQSKIIFLEIAPVDPRSLMQGDYMALQYHIIRQMQGEYDNHENGYIVVSLDNNNVAQFIRTQTQKTPIYNGEYLIAYTTGKYGRIQIGAEAFFFQEGQDSIYQHAQYVAIKIDDNAHPILIGLYDNTLHEIKTKH